MKRLGIYVRFVKEAWHLIRRRKDMTADEYEAEKESIIRRYSREEVE